VIEKVKGLCNNFVNLGVALASKLGVWRSEKPPNKACSRLVGLAPTYKPFSAFGLFFCSQAESQPAHQRLTHTVGRLRQRIMKTGDNYL